jgi:hypothetical protein
LTLPKRRAQALQLRDHTQANGLRQLCDPKMLKEHLALSLDGSDADAQV